MRMGDDDEAGVLADMPRSADSSADAHSQEGAEDDRRLGLRLKARRLERNLSLSQLSAKCGISIGMLSQIERGLSTPSLRTLRMVANALTVPMSWFFTAPEEASPTASPYIVRRADRRLLRLTPTGVIKELLSHASPSIFEMYELLLQPGGSSGAEFFSHEGEKAGLVLSGKLRLIINGDPHVLSAGDSFQFPSILSHHFNNPEADVARVLWIIAPPYAR